MYAEVELSLWSNCRDKSKESVDLKAIVFYDKDWKSSKHVTLAPHRIWKFRPM